MWMLAFPVSCNILCNLYHVCLHLFLLSLFYLAQVDHNHSLPVLFSSQWYFVFLILLTFSNLHMPGPSTGPVPPVPDISNLAVPATSLVYHANTTAASVSMAASPSSLASRSNSTTPSVPLNSSAAYGSLSSAVMYSHNSHNRSMSLTMGMMSND